MEGIFVILFWLVIFVAAANSKKKNTQTKPVLQQKAQQQTQRRAQPVVQRSAIHVDEPEMMGEHDESIHNADFTPMGEYHGSMEFQSQEGIQVDHDHGGKMKYTELQEAFSEPIAPHFTPNALVNAFVMQEVLKRPCDRKR